MPIRCASGRRRMAGSRAAPGRYHPRARGGQVRRGWAGKPTARRATGPASRTSGSRSAPSSWTRAGNAVDRGPWSSRFARSPACGPSSCAGSRRDSGAGRSEQRKLLVVAHHPVEVEAEGGQHGLGHGPDLLVHVVFAVRRVLERVEWLRSSDRDQVGDDAARAPGLSGGGDVRRRARGCTRQGVSAGPCGRRACRRARPAGGRPRCRRGSRPPARPAKSRAYSSRCTSLASSVQSRRTTSMPTNSTSLRPSTSPA